VTFDETLEEERKENRARDRRGEEETKKREEGERGRGLREKSKLRPESGQLGGSGIEVDDPFFYPPSYSPPS
jgi:hypothetical protein